jgi:iron complex outermembrane receptor protein
MTRHAQLLALMATTSLTVIAPAALAQDKPAAKADDSTVVVVTAQKREQKLQDVPMAITVAGAAQLERQQITTVRDLDRVSPAVTFVDGAPGGGAGIRGIATQSFTPSAEASVGIVVDGVPQGNVNVSDLFDMERVEVLRGPQGTLFGQSASAGVINMVTKSPRIGDFSGRLHVDYAAKGVAGSEYGERVVQGVVNLPVNDKSALRVSAFANSLGGVLHDNAIGGDNKNSTYGFRARYLYNLSNNLKLNLIADYSDQTLTGNTVFTFRKAVNASTISALAACGITASESNNLSCSAFPSYDRAKNGGLSAQFDYQLGDYTLTSITSFRARDTGPTSLDIVAQQSEPGADIYPQLHQDAKTQLRQTSQEFRVTSPLNPAYDWVAGVYIARSTNNNHGSKGLTIIPDPVGVIQQLSLNSTFTNTAAIFGQFNWHVTDKLTLLAGARGSDVRVGDSEVFSKILTLPFQPFPPFANVPTDIDLLSGTAPHTAALTSEVKNLSGRLGAQYKISEDLMAYATVSRGFKAPQINDTVFEDGSGNLVDPVVVRPELPTAFEIGTKGMIGRVGVDLNLFYTKVKDYQGQLCVFTPALTCGATNVPEVVTKGVEIDLYGRVLPNLTLNGGFIYNPVTYPDNYVGSDGTDISGTQMTGAPKYKFNLSGEYTKDLVDDYQAYVNFDTTYKSKTSIFPSASDDYAVKARWITGGRVGLRFPDRKTSLSVYVRNLGNTSDPVNIYPGPSTGDIQQILNKQSFRVVGVSLDRNF